MENFKHYNINNVGEKVTISGWVCKIRNLGGLIFIDLRNRSGIMQVIVKPDNQNYDLAAKLRNEYVIKVSGEIVERENKNMKIPTGEIELIVESLELINESIDIPFSITDDTTALEDTRLKYRYLDIRRDAIKNNLILRHQIVMTIRNYLSNLDFIEVETPILCKSTPEGARDYLVPSRIFNGRFYALPQSPQIYKQLLMVGGIERYFQIARCFRDEDLRIDRQPEFTQIDIEMSFVEEEDIWNLVENMLSDVFIKIKNQTLSKFKRIPYNECIRRFGSDKPDLRFEMEISDITKVFNNTSFEIFRNIIKNNGVINAIVVKDGASKFSRKDLDSLTDFVKIYKAKALSYLKYINYELTGSISKVINDEEIKLIIEELNLSNNDLVLIIADQYNIAKIALGALRLKIAKDLDIIDKSKYEFLWVTDFPMFEYSEEEKRYVAAHHPFTAPNKEDIEKLIDDKANCCSRAYDLVLNGYELLSGSIRIHDAVTQKKVFDAIGMSEEEAKEKFGFFLDAFKYGAPPHGGVGIGLERLTMILAGTDNIRDVVAFPKTASAYDLMSEAPNIVDDKQLKELGLHIKS